MRAQADLRPQGTRLDGFGHFTHMWGSTASATSLSLMARAVPFSIVGIVVYRGAYFGVNDTMVQLNPFKKDKGLVGLASKFATAQLSALFSTFLNYPFCVVVDRFGAKGWPAQLWYCFGSSAYAILWEAVTPQNPADTYAVTWITNEQFVLVSKILGAVTAVGAFLYMRKALNIA